MELYKKSEVLNAITDKLIERILRPGVTKTWILYDNTKLGGAVTGFVVRERERTVEQLGDNRRLPTIKPTQAERRAQAQRRTEKYCWSTFHNDKIMPVVCLPIIQYKHSWYSTARKWFSLKRTKISKYSNRMEPIEHYCICCIETFIGPNRVIVNYVSQSLNVSIFDNAWTQLNDPLFGESLSNYDQYNCPILVYVSINR